jgi:hypothetical protein
MAELSGLERAFFGPVSTADVDAWLADAVQERLAVDVAEVLFRAGRIDAVYGLLLGDGRKVVLKVHRPPVDVSGLEALREALSYLASTGYPSPEPVDGPVIRGEHVVTIESLLEQGAPADAREPEIRRELAHAFVDHIRLLRAVEHLGARLPAGPAWTRYGDGPWPVPHDPIFDFTSTPTEWSWLDGFAREAADELLALRGDDALVIGHGDWYDGNARFADGQVVAVFDWDLMTETEAVLTGLAATAYPGRRRSQPVRGGRVRARRRRRPRSRLHRHPAESGLGRRTVGARLQRPVRAVQPRQSRTHRRRRDPRVLTARPAAPFARRIRLLVVTGRTRPEVRYARPVSRSLSSHSRRRAAAS